VQCTHTSTLPLLCFSLTLPFPRSMPQQPNSNGQNVSPQLQYNQASPPPMQFPYPMQPASKLFVGGLAGTVSNNDFFAYFAAYGQVVDSVVMIDKET